MLTNAITVMLAAVGPAQCVASPESSVALVRRFYTTALIEKQVRVGFERDVAPDFIEHKPDIATGNRSGAIAFLEGLVAELPAAKWELLRVTGDTQLVAAQARFTPAEGAPVFAIADFFRVDNCRIVEHWDVVARPPGNSTNTRSRF